MSADARSIEREYLRRLRQTAGPAAAHRAGGARAGQLCAALGTRTVRESPSLEPYGQWFPNDSVELRTPEQTSGIGQWEHTLLHELGHATMTGDRVGRAPWPPGHPEKQKNVEEITAEATAVLLADEIGPDGPWREAFMDTAGAYIAGYAITLDAAEIEYAFGRAATARDLILSRHARWVADPEAVCEEAIAARNHVDLHAGRISGLLENMRVLELHAQDLASACAAAAACRAAAAESLAPLFRDPGAVLDRWGTTPPGERSGLLATLASDPAAIAPLRVQARLANLFGPEPPERLRDVVRRIEAYNEANRAVALRAAEAERMLRRAAYTFPAEARWPVLDHLPLRGAAMDVEVLRWAAQVEHTRAVRLRLWVNAMEPRVPTREVVRAQAQSLGIVLPGADGGPPRAPWPTPPGERAPELAPQSAWDRKAAVSGGFDGPAPTGRVITGTESTHGSSALFPVPPYPRMAEPSQEQETGAPTADPRSARAAQRDALDRRIEEAVAAREAEGLPAPPERPRTGDISTARTVPGLIQPDPIPAPPAAEPMWLQARRPLTLSPEQQATLRDMRAAVYGESEYKIRLLETFPAEIDSRAFVLQHERIVVAEAALYRAAAQLTEQPQRVLEALHAPALDAAAAAGRAVRAITDEKPFIAVDDRAEIALLARAVHAEHARLQEMAELTRAYQEQADRLSAALDRVQQFTVEIAEDPARVRLAVEETIKGPPLLERTADGRAISPRSRVIESALEAVNKPFLPEEDRSEIARLAGAAFDERRLLSHISRTEQMRGTDPRIAAEQQRVAERIEKRLGLQRTAPPTRGQSRGGQPEPEARTPFDNEAFRRSAAQGNPLWRAEASGCDLSGADLPRVQLAFAQLDGSNMEGANFRFGWFEDSDLREANFRNATLMGCNFIGADLRGADLRETDMRAADLSWADLRGADLRGADLSNVDLQSADLRGADLTGVNLAGSDLRGANLTDARLVNTQLASVRWQGAITANADFAGARASDLPEPDLQMLNAIRTHLREQQAVLDEVGASLRKQLQAAVPHDTSQVLAAIGKTGTRDQAADAALDAIRTGSLFEFEADAVRERAAQVWDAQQRLQTITSRAAIRLGLTRDMFPEEILREVARRRDEMRRDAERQAGLRDHRSLPRDEPRMQKGGRFQDVRSIECLRCGTRDGRLDGRSQLETDGTLKLQRDGSPVRPSPRDGKVCTPCSMADPAMSVSELKLRQRTASLVETSQVRYQEGQVGWRDRAVESALREQAARGLATPLEARLEQPSVYTTQRSPAEMQDFRADELTAAEIARAEREEMGQWDLPGNGDRESEWWDRKFAGLFDGPREDRPDSTPAEILSRETERLAEARRRLASIVGIEDKGLRDVLVIQADARLHIASGSSVREAWEATRGIPRAEARTAARSAYEARLRGPDQLANERRLREAFGLRLPKNMPEREKLAVIARQVERVLKDLDLPTMNTRLRNAEREIDRALSRGSPDPATRAEMMRAQELTTDLRSTLDSVAAADRRTEGRLSVPGLVETARQGSFVAASGLDESVLDGERRGEMHERRIDRFINDAGNAGTLPAGSPQSAAELERTVGQLNPGRVTLEHYPEPGTKPFETRARDAQIAAEVAETGWTGPDRILQALETYTEQAIARGAEIGDPFGEPLRERIIEQAARQAGFTQPELDQLRDVQELIAMGSDTQAMQTLMREASGWAKTGQEINDPVANNDFNRLLDAIDARSENGSRITLSESDRELLGRAQAAAAPYLDAMTRQGRNGSRARCLRNCVPKSMPWPEKPDTRRCAPRSSNRLTPTWPASPGTSARWKDSPRSMPSTSR